MSEVCVGGGGGGTLGLTPVSGPVTGCESELVVRCEEIPGDRSPLLLRDAELGFEARNRL